MWSLYITVTDKGESFEKCKIEKHIFFHTFLIPYVLFYSFLLNY